MSPYSVLKYGVLWTVVIGGLALLYGMYELGIGAAAGVVTLVLLVAASIGLLIVCWHYRKPVALVNYELWVSALWIGNFLGWTNTSKLVDVEWSCILFLGWVVAAVLGGLLLASRVKS